MPRLGLLPRIVVALVVVGGLPVLMLWLTLWPPIEDGLDLQVQRTHLTAVRTAGERVDEYLFSRLELGRSLSTNPLVASDPRSAESQEILAASLASQPSVVGFVLVNDGGETVVRVQKRDEAAMVDRLLDLGDAAAVEAELVAGDLWVRFAVGLPGGKGTLILVDRAERLASRLLDYQLGGEAELALVDDSGEVLLASAALPKELRELRQDKGGQVKFVEIPGRGKVVAAFWPLRAAPWTVISSEPDDVARAIRLALRRRIELSAALAVLLALVVVTSAYRVIVQPIRGMLAAQRRLDPGRSGESVAGDEIVALRDAFDQLAERVRHREEFGRVFLGRYQVLEILGEGAMGMVFRGWDPRLRRAVALKTIQLGRTLGQEERGRLAKNLVAEGVAAARFSHPHIVAIYDAQDLEDAAYVAMELVDGTSLEKLVWERRSLPPELAVPVALAVAEALAAAHREGLVHRDIKPANVLLGFDDSIKVTDFGIANFLSQLDDGSTRVFGTPGYLAPEVIRGQPFTEQADLFALGVLLFQCLSGRRPFIGRSTRDVLHSTLLRQPEPIGAIVPGAPPELEELCADLLAKKPEGRPASAAVAAECLSALVTAKGWRWRLGVAGPGAGPPGPLPHAPSRWMATMPVPGGDTAAGEHSVRPTGSHGTEA